VSFVSFTSVHQQPVIVAPHVNSFPHASQVEGSFQRSEMYPSARRQDVIDTHTGTSQQSFESFESL